jgi:CelD/BcsL family acetyltransferase involved in cellulose biosynthesis
MTHLLLRERLSGGIFDHGSADAMRPARPGGGVAPSGMPVELAMVTSLDGLMALEADWTALHAEVGQTAHVFQSFNWCWHWCRHYLSDTAAGPRLAIVTGRVAGRLALVFPLVVQRSAGLLELTWLGAPVSQYGDLIAAPDAADLDTLLAAWDLAVAQTGADVANLRRVRADAMVAPLLERIGAVVTATEDAPYLDLARDTSFAGWEERRQPKARKNRRRQERRLAEMGETAFIGEAGNVEAGVLAGHAVRLKRETLGNKGAISTALSDQRFEAFFTDVAHGLGRPAGVTVLAITCAGLPAAIKIVLESKGAAFLHVAVFEPRFERCAPGALLLEHLIDRTLRSRRHTLDLLPPRHEYKMDFGDGVVRVRDYAKALSTTGWLYTQGYLRLRRRLKSIVEALPHPVRKLIARLAGGG